MAIMGVIILHVFYMWPNPEIMNLKIYSFRQIFMYAVPLFLMLTGALMLNREIELKSFFKSKLPRIIYPFMFYLIIHLCIILLMLHFFGHSEILDTYISVIPFKYNWYFWLILGVYITLPVINKFVQSSSMKEIEYFIGVLFVGSIFYQIMFIFNLDQHINLNFIICPVAYLVLGYYLSHKDFGMSSGKIITISIILFIAMTLIKMAGGNGDVPFDYVSGFDITTTSRVATRIDLSIFELIHVSALFLMIRYLFESRTGIYAKIRGFFEKNSIVKLYTSISRSSYGMYLFNRTLLIPIEIAVATLTLTGSQVCGLILILAVGATLIVWLVVLVFHKIPFINRYCGYH
ncbi:acyltransferase [Methanobrevibacter sp.]|uniref:acyltransferase n=1 Tax=Methanobrevibacter sp. TaxID=66852 RepID=UPI003890F825